MHLGPGCAPVGGAVDAIQAVVVGAEERIHVVGVGSRSGHFAARRSAGGHSVAHDLGPGGPKVAREPHSAVGAGSGVQQVGRAGHGGQRLKASALHHGPGRAAVGGAVHAAARRHYQVLGLGRVDHDARQASVVGQLKGEASGLPRGSAVGGFKHADAVGVVGVAVARGDVHRVGIQRVDGDSAHAQVGKQVGIRRPCSALVGGLPQSARRSAGKHDVGVGGVERNRVDAPNALHRVSVERPYGRPLADSADPGRGAAPILLNLLHSLVQYRGVGTLPGRVDAGIHKRFPALELLPAFAFFGGFALKGCVKFADDVVHVARRIVPQFQPLRLVLSKKASGSNREEC